MRSIVLGVVILATAGSGLAQVCAPAPYGIIHWYPAEGNARDAIGSNHGGIMGTVGFATGMVRQAFQFHGNPAEAVNLGDVPAFNFTATSSFSIEAWVNVASYPVTPNDGMVIVSLNYNCNQPSPATQTLAIQGGTNRAFFHVRDKNGSQAYVFSPTAVPLNTWIHLVGVRDASCSKIYLYMNGVMVNQAGYSTSVSLSNLNVPDYIGRRSLCGTYNPFKGRIDEVSFYDRALTTCEISALFSANCAGKCRPNNCPAKPCGC